VAPRSDENEMDKFECPVFVWKNKIIFRPFHSLVEKGDRRSWQHFGKVQICDERFKPFHSLGEKEGHLNEVEVRRTWPSNRNSTTLLPDPRIE